MIAYKVVLTSKADNTLQNIVTYIANEILMPETGIKYGRRMREFALSIGSSPLAWPICKGKKYSSKNYHCAVFDDKWIFAYSISGNKVIIREIINGKLIKE
jgi:hypothetical protein